ncbi:MAG TPA: EamA family transporter RarD [Pirellulaceae bacterium]|nr:EamA family transporter RarD [Pirellulaceae bacterium]
MDDDHAKGQAVRLGVLYGLAAYGLWGVFPLMFKPLFAYQATPLEILAHRAIWSFLFLAVIVTAQHRWRELIAAFRTPRVLGMLAASTALIAVNWLAFLWAVSTEQVMQSSLGYFLTPLANVALGVLVLQERLRIGQSIGIGLATVGVLVMATAGDRFPWIALTLAVSFAFYGLCRKTVAVDSLIGLTAETLLMTPLGIAGVIWLETTGRAPADGWEVYMLLIAAGVATAIPLLFFAASARRLSLVTIGFLQFLGPTIQFLVAVFAFGEAFDPVKQISFGFIWLAVAVYIADSLWAYRAGRRQPRLEDSVAQMPLEDL